MTENDLVHDCKLAFTSKNSEGKGYSTGSTFFIKPHEKPRFLLECLAQEVFKYHANRIGKEGEGVCKSEESGAEWWCQVIDTRDDIGWHWDRDYGKEEDGDLMYPDVATVTYLSKQGGCTAVAKVKGKAVIGDTFDANGHAITEVILSRPGFGKQLYFDGRYLHGAPADFDGDEEDRSDGGGMEDEDEDEDSESEEDEWAGKKKGKKSPLRITFLVNVWLNNIPAQSTRFPDELASNMRIAYPQGRPHVTVTTWADPPKEKTQALVIAKGEKGEPSKWTFSDCSRRYSISLPFKSSEALKVFSAGEADGETLLVDLKNKPGTLHDLGPVEESEEEGGDDYNDDDVPLKRAKKEELQISTASPSTCMVEEMAEIINRAYDVEKGNTGSAFKKKGVDRISDPNSLMGDLEAGNILMLKDGLGELLGVIGFEMKGDSCSFGPFAAKYKGRGHGRLLLGELEKLARKEGKKQLALVVVNHRTELVSLYEKWGFKLTGKTTPYPMPELLTRPSHFIHMSRVIL